TTDIVVSHRGERFTSTPWGLEGGQPGKSARAFIVRRNGGREELPSLRRWSCCTPATNFGGTSQAALDSGIPLRAILTSSQTTFRMERLLATRASRGSCDPSFRCAYHRE